MIYAFLAMIEDEDDKEFILSLYKQYYPLMKQQALSLIRDHTLVDDQIQDAFLKLIPKISLLRSLISYKKTSYIVNTLKHVCLDYIRKEKRRTKYVFSGKGDDIAANILDLQAATEENFLKQEGFKTLEQVMLQLIERDRNLLYFKYNMDLSDKQIGELLGIPKQHVRQYIARARHRVLQMLTIGDDDYDSRE